MLAVLALLLAASPPPVPPAAASAPAAPTTLGPEWDVLAGRWVGEGDGSPGSGGGITTFEVTLERHAVLRRSTSDYPAKDGRPATHHEDLLVLAPGAPATARYWDNEGHAITYAATWSADGRSLALESDAGAPGPRFRLTYAFASHDEASVTFEMAPPGSSAYRPYLAGKMRRETDGGDQAAGRPIGLRGRRGTGRRRRTR